jgi:hypothetical protein
MQNIAERRIKMYLTGLIILEENEIELFNNLEKKLRNLLSEYTVFNSDYKMYVELHQDSHKLTSPSNIGFLKKLNYKLILLNSYIVDNNINTEKVIKILFIESILNVNILKLLSEHYLLNDYVYNYLIKKILNINFDYCYINPVTLV